MYYVNYVPISFLKQAAGATLTLTPAQLYIPCKLVPLNRLKFLGRPLLLRGSCSSLRWPDLQGVVLSLSAPNTPAVWGADFQE